VDGLGEAAGEDAGGAAGDDGRAGEGGMLAATLFDGVGVGEGAGAGELQAAVSIRLTARASAVKRRRVGVLTRCFKDTFLPSFVNICTRQRTKFGGKRQKVETLGYTGVE
jgi:hypothetical protein